MEQIRILVADDERIERSILCRKLAREFGESCELLQAENGREAIRVFQEKRTQIAILDIAMPGINGIEAAAQIRELDENCIIIFLTAYSDFNYSIQAIRLRAMDYLTKPYEDEELFAVIEAAVYQAQKSGGDRLLHDRAEGPDQSESIRAAENPQPVPYREDSVISERTVTEIRDFIDQNYMHDISMQDAAQCMHYSDTYFCKLFKQGFGCNFTTYLTSYRMKEAERLLKTTELSVREVGLRTGYADANYFAKVFKRQTGVIPSEYRN